MIRCKHLWAILLQCESGWGLSFEASHNAELAKTALAEGGSWSAEWVVGVGMERQSGAGSGVQSSPSCSDAQDVEYQSCRYNVLLSLLWLLFSFECGIPN